MSSENAQAPRVVPLRETLAGGRVRSCRFSKFDSRLSPTCQGTASPRATTALYLTKGSRRLADTVRVLLSFAIALLHALRACVRSQREQAFVELALRQQLAVLADTGRRPKLTSLDRAFWVLLRQLWPRWREVLVVVRPETVVRWHRQGFRLYWRFRPRRRPGRPRIPKDARELIRRMARENPWGARNYRVSREARWIASVLPAGCVEVG